MDAATSKSRQAQAVTARPRQRGGEPCQTMAAAQVAHVHPGKGAWAAQLNGSVQAAGRTVVALRTETQPEPAPLHTGWG